MQFIESNNFKASLNFKFSSNLKGVTINSYIFQTTLNSSVYDNWNFKSPLELNGFYSDPKNKNIMKTTMFTIGEEAPDFTLYDVSIKLIVDVG